MQPTVRPRIYPVMPVYHFCLRHRNVVAHRSPASEYPDLRAALVGAQRAAGKMVRQRVRHHEPVDRQDSFDIEDDRHQPVARILLADLARQLR